MGRDETQVPSAVKEVVLWLTSNLWSVREWTLFEVVMGESDESTIQPPPQQVQILDRLSF